LVKTNNANNLIVLNFAINCFYNFAIKFYNLIAFNEFAINNLNTIKPNKQLCL